MQTWLATETSSPNAGASLAASSAGLDTNAQGCSTIENIYSSCETATPGFTDLADADAASCLCYSGNTWVPNVLDNAAASCATYFAENDDATDASTLAALTNFCSSIGNVLTMASTSASATPAGSSSGSAAATSTSAGSASAAASASSGASASATSDSGSSSSSAAVGGSQVCDLKFEMILADICTDAANIAVCDCSTYDTGVEYSVVGSGTPLIDERHKSVGYVHLASIVHSEKLSFNPLPILAAR